MKYENDDGHWFEIDARPLVAAIQDGSLSEAEMDVRARKLAKDYDIPETDIWDYLADL